MFGIYSAGYTSSYRKSTLIYCKLNILGYIILRINYIYKWMDIFCLWLKFQKLLNIGSKKFIDTNNVFIVRLNEI